MSDAKSQYRREIGAAGGPQRLVILLYEQLIHDLHRAMSAIDQGNIEKRTNELSHALEVIGELQARLDMQRGGEVSANLDRYYNALRRCLLEAQVAGSKEILRAQVSHLISLREAWVQVEKATVPTAPATNTGASSAAGARSTPGTDWTG